MINNIDINKISGISNSQYFLENYLNYFDSHKKKNLLLIDLKGFKNINDTFGHTVGDEYIILFSEILMSSFKHSLVSRLHGDEFAILTDYSNEEIINILNEINEKIKKAVQVKIPVDFKYNCGVVEATKNYEDSFNKADYMMYYAKKNEQIVQFFDKKIWQKKLDIEDFSERLINDCKLGKLTYQYMQLFDSKKRPTDIIQIYTRSERNKNLFDDNTYIWLRDNHRINYFDTTNVINIILRSKDNMLKKIIYVDYMTLNNSDYFIRTISSITGKVDVSNIVISIDLSNFNPFCYKKLIDNINFLKKLGFSILFDKYNTSLPDQLWEEIEPEFTSISKTIWKSAIDDDKAKHILKNKLELFNYYANPTIPIFTCVESKEQFDYLCGVSNDYSLYSGKYLSNEKKLTLK